MPRRWSARRPTAPRFWLWPAPATPSFRRQLESLLSYDKDAQGTLIAPAAEVLVQAMAAGTASLVGRQLGAYRIEAPLGSGGMGEVYRANDTRLHREVAVKILPPHVRDDAELRQRLEREAQALAALHHPHICVLHDVGHAEGVDFLVMELLDGETLADRLVRGPLPLEAALQHGIEIADALIAIHRHGLVHRDLKPGNVMLTSSGAKLLDFGLAKVRGSMLIAASNGDGAPTTAIRGGFSTVAGTLPYMTPEQLDRKEVDHRSDIFAFGALLFEMVTGGRAFDAPDRDQVIAAIRERDAPRLPAPIEREWPGLEILVQKCLRKQPEDRWQDASEIADALRRLRDSATSGASLPRRGRFAAAAAALAGSLAVGTALWMLQNGPATGASSLPALALGNALPLTSGDAIEFDPALSPVGDLIAYTAGFGSDFRLVVRQVASRETRTIAVPPSSQVMQPRWSPDGRSLLYITLEGVFVSQLAGGDPRRVAAAADVAGTYSTYMPEGNWITAAAWSPSGDDILVAHGGGFYVVGIDTGTRRHLVTVRDEFHWCEWSPDGRWIACTLGNPHVGLRQQFGNLAPSAVVIVPAAGGTPIEIAPRTAMNQSPVWSADSRRLYFVSNRQGPSDIYGVAIGEDGHARGDVVRLSTGLGAYSIALSPDRTRLAYSALATRANLWTLPIPGPGTTADLSTARQLTTGNQLIEAIHVTPDRQWLVYDSTLYGNSDIFRMPIGGGTPVRLTDHPADDFGPAVSPDGRLLAFHSWRTKSRDIFVQPLEGGPAQQLTHSPRGEALPLWLPDGSVMYMDYEQQAGQLVGGLFVVRPAADGTWAAPERLDLPGKPGNSAATRDGRIVFPNDLDIDIARPGGAWMTIYKAGPNGARPERVALDEDDTTVYFKSHDDLGRASFWSVPITGGPATLLLRFDDLARPSRRWDFDVGNGQLYFTIDERRSNIWVADVSDPSRD